MSAKLALAPPPPKKRRGVRENPTGGVKPTPGGKRFKDYHEFETTGEFRLWKNGKPGEWQRGVADGPC